MLTRNRGAVQRDTGACRPCSANYSRIGREFTRCRRGVTMVLGDLTPIMAGDGGRASQRQHEQNDKDPSHIPSLALMAQ